MNRTSTEEHIRARIDAFVGEISALMRAAALESVRGVLGEAAAPLRRAPGRPPKSRALAARPARSTAAPAPRAKRGKRSSEQVDELASRVLAHVRQHPGQGLEQIGRELGLPTKELKLPVAKLLAARALRTQGRKRGTKYFAGAAKKRARPAKRARVVATKLRRKIVRPVGAVRAARARNVKAATPEAAPQAAPEAEVASTIA